MSALMVVMIVFMMAGFFGSGLHQKMMGDHDKKDQKEESVMHNHDKKPSKIVPVETEKMEDISKMMTEMQKNMLEMDKMMEGTHTGMSNDDMTKMHERMTQMREQMKQMRQQLSDMHQQMMKEGEGGMMGRGTMGHDPSTREGHMGGTE